MVIIERGLLVEVRRAVSAALLLLNVLKNVLNILMNVHLIGVSVLPWSVGIFAVGIGIGTIATAAIPIDWRD